MAIEIIVPRLGWSMDEGLFGEWLKQDGDHVNAGEMLFVLEGDKSAQEIESFDAGILRIAASAPQPGDPVVVGQILGYLVAEGEVPPFDSSDKVGVAVQAQTAPPDSESGLAVVPSSAAAPSLVKTRITPRARRVARDLGIDWTGSPGSGRNGRIRERDIRALASRAPREPAALPGASQPITQFRRAIAQRMLAGVQQAAPVTLTTKADATELVLLRNRLKSGDAIRYTDMLVKIAAISIRRHPEIQAQWHDDHLLIPSEVNIAVAVDTPVGLLAPVIRNVPSKTLAQVGTESSELIELARRGQLKLEFMRDATFTITNLGGYGIDAFTPIINLPQSAVLGVGRIVREPVVVGESIVARDMLTLSLTFDHRVTDGGPAAKFLNDLRQRIEQPAEDLVV